MPDVINSLWIGSALGPLQQLAVSSFLRAGYEYRLYQYGPVAGVPPGTILCDGNEILPASSIFYYRTGAAQGSVAAFSNLFRYKLLLDQGGWWVDTDVVLLQPFPGEPVVLASELTPRGVNVASAVIKLPPGHEIARRCFQRADTSDKHSLRWGEIGPRLLDQVVTDLGAWHQVRPPAVFCPIPSWRWEALLTDAAPYIESDTLAVHLWYERWRRAGREAAVEIPRGSLLARLAGDNTPPDTVKPGPA